MIGPRQFVIEILGWDCGFFLQLSPASTPPEYRFQGGLLFTSSLYIEGRIISPRSHEEWPIRLWTQAMDPQLDDGPEMREAVGWLGERPFQDRREIQGYLGLPAAAIPTAATCLAATWRYIEIEAVDAEDGAMVTSFSFSRTGGRRE